VPRGVKNLRYQETRRFMAWLPQVSETTGEDRMVCGACFESQLHPWSLLRHRTGVHPSPPGFSRCGPRRSCGRAIGRSSAHHPSPVPVEHWSRRRRHFESGHHLISTLHRCTPLAPAFVPRHHSSHSASRLTFDCAGRLFRTRRQLCVRSNPDFRSHRRGKTLTPSSVPHVQSC